MRLWESYFRLWDKMTANLTERQRRSEFKDVSFEEEERAQDYYGFLCDKDVCLESGV